MKKNEKYTLDIIDNGMEFEGIGKINNIPVFINNALKGERVIAKILKVNKSHAFAMIENIEVKSKNRENPVCEAYSKCGGCEALHTTYENTLEMKLNMVKNVIRKQGLDSDAVKEIYGMGNPYWYRNKVQYPVRQINNKMIMGMYSKRSHNIVENKECFILDKKIHEIANELFKNLVDEKFKGYNETDNTGDIKNIAIRRGLHTDEVMCIIVVTEASIKEDDRLNKVIQQITRKYKNIKSIMLNVNDKKDNVILSDTNICMFGDDYITDMIGEYTFKISPNSFFQVNTLQAEVLYNLLKENMGLRKDKTLLELYSGVGSIGMFLADSVKEVYGVEIVEEAVKMANDNSKLNNVTNTTYIQADATESINKLDKEGKVFDYIVVDPPRKGLDKDGIETIIKLAPKKIGYISCNASTLARDLKILSNTYEVTSINLVDMFPWTSHVECVILLHRKKS